LKKLEHLSEIYTAYDTFIIDLWGVVHNGIALNKKAIEVIEKLTEKSKKIVFLSNAPRSSETVREFLKQLNMNDKFLKNLVTSGEAAISAINKNRFGKLFYHLGPAKDDSIFYNVKKNKTELEKSEFILCTGLFDGYEDDLDYYENLLKKSISKKLICTNPDITVHRGDKEEYCAGAIAQIFESLGGSVVYFGKPHKEIYKMCFKENDKVIAIGDNLRTDIMGANNLKIDSIFISNGVHRNEFKDYNDLTELLKTYKVSAKYFQPELIW
jgi:HAD superfamily hydrolase (TIGR01459 family)